MHRYIGNKTKIVNEILYDVEKLIGQSGTVVDLMCGTASVSKALNSQGYSVIAVDLMTHASFHATVELLIDGIPDFSGLKSTLAFSETEDNECRYLKVLKYLNELEPKEGYFFREFSPEGKPKNYPEPRKYFTADNAKKLDAIIDVLNTWRDKNFITNLENALLRHDLILSVNPIANISGTYGHFHAKPVKRSLDPLIIESHLDIDLFSEMNSSKNHKVYRGYAEEISKDLTADLCYIDPPYMKRQYAANYHILETIARGDNPEAIGASGLRPWRDQYSNFCSKVKIRDSFRQIFNNMKCKTFLISYSEDGLLTLNELKELFEEFGVVEVRSFSHKRFRSNNSSLGNELSEYLISLKIK
ncbi:MULTISPECIES: DNA adenine methylase [Bacillus]|uniref:DNA adenine methylase n=1 Tax=Bacillus TaxID=1386 RepID=UPI000BF0AB86|nr:DNA adenine methylase [Bacillus pseudomycoides]PEL25825.1 hypothetical protein CN608_13825 [Bacillus pseudomycoides]